VDTCSGLVSVELCVPARAFPCRFVGNRVRQPADRRCRSRLPEFRNPFLTRPERNFRFPPFPQLLTMRTRFSPSTSLTLPRTRIIFFPRTFAADERPLLCCLAFASRVRSEMRSRSQSATALIIVNTSCEMPSVTFPPRSTRVQQRTKSVSCCSEAATTLTALTKSSARPHATPSILQALDVDARETPARRGHRTRTRRREPPRDPRRNLVR
jgi:hypothetical protein